MNEIMMTTTDDVIDINELADPLAGSAVKSNLEYHYLKKAKDKKNATLYIGKKGFDSEEFYLDTDTIEGAIVSAKYRLIYEIKDNDVIVERAASNEFSNNKEQVNMVKYEGDGADKKTTVLWSLPKYDVFTKRVQQLQDAGVEEKYIDFTKLQVILYVMIFADRYADEEDSKIRDFLGNENKIFKVICSGQSYSPANDHMQALRNKNMYKASKLNMLNMSMNWTKIKAVMDKNDAGKVYQKFAFEIGEAVDPMLYETLTKCTIAVETDLRNRVEQARKKNAEQLPPPVQEVKKELPPAHPTEKANTQIDLDSLPF